MIPLTEESHPKQVQCAIDLMKKLHRDDMVYCDVGGCIGELLQYYCQIMKRGYVFEPNIHNYEYLKNEYSNKGVVVENLAVHSSSSDLDFISTGGVGDHVGRLVQFQEVVNESEYKLNKVSCITLDEYFKDKDIDFIKIDVEGTEWEVLEGAEEIMSKKKVIFQVEFHWDSDWNNRHQLIYDRGYKIYSLDLEILDKDCARPYQAILSGIDI